MMAVNEATQAMSGRETAGGRQDYSLAASASEFRFGVLLHEHMSADWEGGSWWGSHKQAARQQPIKNVLVYPFS